MFKEKVFFVFSILVIQVSLGMNSSNGQKLEHIENAESNDLVTSSNKKFDEKSSTFSIAPKSEINIEKIETQEIKEPLEISETIIKDYTNDVNEILKNLKEIEQILALIQDQEIDVSEIKKEKENPVEGIELSFFKHIDNLSKICQNSKEQLQQYQKDIANVDNFLKPNTHFVPFILSLLCGTYCAAYQKTGEINPLKILGISENLNLSFGKASLYSLLLNLGFNFFFNKKTEYSNALDITWKTTLAPFGFIAYLKDWLVKYHLSKESPVKEFEISSVQKSNLMQKNSSQCFFNNNLHFSTNAANFGGKECVELTIEFSEEKDEILDSFLTTSQRSFDTLQENTKGRWWLDRLLSPSDYMTIKITNRSTQAPITFDRRLLSTPERTNATVTLRVNKLLGTDPLLDSSYKDGVRTFSINFLPQTRHTPDCECPLACLCDQNEEKKQLHCTCDSSRERCAPRATISVFFKYYFLTLFLRVITAIFNTKINSEFVNKLCINTENFILFPLKTYIKDKNILAGMNKSSLFGINFVTHMLGLVQVGTILVLGPSIFNTLIGRNSSKRVINLADNFSTSLEKNLQNQEKQINATKKILGEDQSKINKYVTAVNSKINELDQNLAKQNKENEVKSQLIGEKLNSIKNKLSNLQSKIRTVFESDTKWFKRIKEELIPIYVKELKKNE